MNWNAFNLSVHVLVPFLIRLQMRSIHMLATQCDVKSKNINKDDIVLYTFFSTCFFIPKREHSRSCHIYGDPVVPREIRSIKNTKYRTVFSFRLDGYIVPERESIKVSGQHITTNVSCEARIYLWKAMGIYPSISIFAEMRKNLNKTSYKSIRFYVMSLTGRYLQSNTVQMSSSAFLDEWKK